VPFHGIYFAARGAAPTLVLFHGNGETVAWTLPLANDLAATGLGVLLAEYRGYGMSALSGVPSEEGLYDDGAAALAFLHDAGVPKERIVLWGTSLGTGVASELAASGQAARLILCSPYTSIRDMAARFGWFLPTRWILREQFDTLAKASRIHVPTLVIHGDHDEIVPFAMGRIVASAIEGATLIRVPGGHHNDLYARDPTLLEQIVAFARR
jgi:pimeloyl-ACP methyl ester carboxylesterase